MAHDFDGNGRSDNVGVVMAGLTFIDKIYGFNYLDDEKDPVEFLEAITNNYRLVMIGEESRKLSKSMMVSRHKQSLVMISKEKMLLHDLLVAVPFHIRV